MPTLPTSVLPKRIPHGPHKPSTAIQVSPLLLEAAKSDPEEVLRKLQTSKAGLSGDEAGRRFWDKFSPPHFGFTPGPTPGRFLVLRRAGPPEPSPIRIVLNWTETIKK